MFDLPENIQKLIIDYTHLELLSKILNEDLNQIQNSSILLKKPYLTFIQSVIISVRQDLQNVKKTMYQQGLKVYTPSFDGDYYKYQYAWKGRTGSQLFWLSGMLLEISKRLDQYIGVESDYSQ